MTQDAALAILKTGKNAFLTGEPGAGKTYTINQYTTWLRSHSIEPAMTASTGIAATHINGQTIHAWSGIGIKKHLSGEDYGRLLENDKLVGRLNAASVLIIDEVSMLDAATLDAVDGVCRSLRQDGRAFGGLQVVFVGDFFQLPPVARYGEPKPEFCYRSQAWQDAVPIVCYLTEQHRQEDGIFLSLLGALRRGTISQDVRDYLATRRLTSRGNDAHTRLYSHNLDVDRVNEERLLRIDTEERSFEMTTQGPSRYVERIVQSCLSPERLTLRIGARVMFTKNHPDGRFVNGTLGEVIAFEPLENGDVQPVVRTLDGRDLRPLRMDWAIQDGDRTLAKITQFPLRLAWAITIHKSQGMTLDAAVMDLSQTFEYGQGYVALSRVRSSDGLHLLGWNDRALQVHPQILGVDAIFRSASEQAWQATHEITPQQQQASEERFILACGGTVEAVSISLKEKAPPKSATPKGATYLTTLALYREGKSINEIAEARGLVPSTVCNHIEKLSEDGVLKKEELLRVVPEHLLHVMPILHQALMQSEGHLSPVYEKFAGKYSFDDLRLARMTMIPSSEGL